MKFKKIKIKNIRSYNDQELEFPEGSFLLSGDVGSGKTSILLAIEYGLFGLQPGQKGASLLRNDKNIGEVTLELEVSGRQIIIERRLKRTPKGVSNEYASINIDGIKIESSLTEIKSKIIEILGYPSEFIKKNNILYRYTVYSPQEQMKQIIMEDPESRLNILRHVFGIDKYKQIKDNLFILLNNLKSSLKVLQFEISSLDDEKEILKSKKINLTIIEEKIKNKKIELIEKIKIKDLAETELKRLKERIEEKRSFLGEIEKTNIIIITKNEQIISIKKEIEEINKAITKEDKIFEEEEYISLTNEIDKIKLDLDKIMAVHFSLTGKSNSLIHEREEILEKKERIFRIDICPTCLQDVQENYKHNILNETENKLSKIKSALDYIDAEKKEIASLVKSKKERLANLDQKKIEFEILRSKISYLERSKEKLKKLNVKEETLKSDIVLLSKHINSLKENALKYTLFESKFKRKESELRQAVIEEKNTEIFLAELRKELQWSSIEIMALIEKIKEKENSKKKLYELNELIDWLSSQFLKLIEVVERNVLLKLRNEFSSLFRKWFLVLVSHDALETQIDENFTPIIMQGGAEMDYSFLSGGERTAVALAYRLALNQTINSLLSQIKTRGIIILDEPTDGFSEAQIVKIRDILEELKAEQLIIVSHEQKIEGFVDNVLKVIKEGDSSFVEGTQTPGPNHQKT